MNGYVFSFSVRGGTQELKSYVLDEKDYVDENGKSATDDSDFKIKSEVKARRISVTMGSGKKQNNKTVYEKKVVFWSRKYAVKAKAERNEIIAKAMALISDPKKYNKATAYGAAAYVGNIDYDKETGEVKEKQGKKLILNTDKIREEEKYDDTTRSSRANSICLKVRSWTLIKVCGRLRKHSKSQRATFRQDLFTYMTTRTSTRIS
jgi:hypothetical protein